MVLILESRSHLDLGDLPNLLAAELGVMTVRLERAIRSLDGVARVHVNRWGDGSAHLHMWFLARPYGRLQLRGTFLSLWDSILPPISEDTWRENLALVAAWLAEFGGRPLAEPPRIQWQAPSSLAAQSAPAEGQTPAEGSTPPGRRTGGGSLLEAIGEGVELPDVPGGPEESTATGAVPPDRTASEALPEAGSAKAGPEAAAEDDEHRGGQGGGGLRQEERTSPEQKPAVEAPAPVRPVPSQRATTGASDTETETADADATAKTRGTEAAALATSAERTPADRSAESQSAGASDGAASPAGRPTNT
ncbi:hypothetical protein [Micromonospora sp. NPDC051296]|uniref:hypothetical protein n=1 Tax=Micromonospora sp. NPDC051296 TaxID=3155046 RepID=UPI003428AE28